MTRKGGRADLADGPSSPPNGPAMHEPFLELRDIGKTYPAHLKAMLLDDPVQAPLLQGLYTSQLRIELLQIRRHRRNRQARRLQRIL